MKTIKSLAAYLLLAVSVALSACTKDAIPSDYTETVWVGKSSGTSITLEFTQDKNKCVITEATDGYFCALNYVMTIDWSSKNTFTLYYPQDDTKKCYYSGTIRKDKMDFNYLDDDQKVSGTVKLSRQ